MCDKVLMKGNEAFAEAAIRYGCKYYFGYPITPQNEIPEYMSRELPKIGGSFVQAESEIAAINMAYGASISGGRALVSSSSPGIALMQEQLSFMCSTESPIVIINVARVGPGIGSIQPGQADYYQATRGGGNGDYHLIVLAPSSIQEAVDLIGKAYELADHYRNPVMILVDGMIGQMMEQVILPKCTNRGRHEKSWVLTGTKDKREPIIIRSCHLKVKDLEKSNQHLFEKYNIIREKEVIFESIGLENAEVVFVAYGSIARIVGEARESLEEEGIKAGLIRPISLWPFPYKAFDKMPETARGIITVELNQGQMIDDVKIGVNGRFPVYHSGKFGGTMIMPEEVIADAKKLLGE